MSVCGKNFNIAIFSDTMIDVQLYVMVMSITYSYNFQWSWLHFKITEVSVSTENFMFFYDWVENFYNYWSSQIDHEYTTIHESERLLFLFSD